MLKKWLICILIALLGIASGCAKRSPSFLSQWMQSNGKIKVLSTTAMIGDIVSEIGGDQVDLLTLIVGEMNPHSYELVKGDDEKLNYAEVIFYNGLGLEHGASLQYHLLHHQNALALGDYLYNRSNERFLKVGGQVDPHFWMDVSMWAQIVDPIVEALSLHRPECADFFRENGERVRTSLLRTHEEFQKKMHKIPSDRRFLVSSHDAFHYFARAYLADAKEADSHAWQKRVMAPEGLAPDDQISVVDIQKVISHLSKYRIHVIFPESNVNQDSLRKILQASQSLGMKLRLSNASLYGDSMGQSGSYLKMMKHNIETLSGDLEKE